ncbi:MAG TPA: hypothetical protein DCS93_15965 [Microscillaceae bacterium]|nr:hypothetical protein [Microscillaceae bacterium]
MKKRRKTDECLNCGLVFEVPDEFCPRCGQENHQRIKSVRLFLIDSFKDVVDIDSRFYRSVKPFLFKPGRLTNEYISGRRKHYVQPIRLYLLLSFIYFFASSMELNKLTNKKDFKSQIKKSAISDDVRRKQDSLKINELFYKYYKINPGTLPDSIKKSTLIPADSQFLAKINDGFQTLYIKGKSRDSLRKVKRDSLKHAKRLKKYSKKLASYRKKLAKIQKPEKRERYEKSIQKTLRDSTRRVARYALLLDRRSYRDSLNRFVKSSEDSLQLVKALADTEFKLDSINKIIFKYYTPNLKGDNFGGLTILDVNVQKVTDLSAEGLKEKAIMDSLGIEKNWINKFIVHQSIRWADATLAQLASYTVEKLPIVMFFVLPFFALLLTLVYVRHKRYYVEHIIFTLHIHSFAYLLFALGILFIELLPKGAPYIVGATFLLLFVYSYKSFRNVYRQGRFKTLVKMILIGSSYSFVLLFALILGIFISLLLF